jgi:hypothetical protein
LQSSNKHTSGILHPQDAAFLKKEVFFFGKGIAFSKKLWYNIKVEFTQQTERSYGEVLKWGRLRALPVAE